jgi:hypothetical protein
MVRLHWWLSALLISSPLLAQGTRPPAERCEAAPAGWPAAPEWLARARRALGFPAGDSVLAYQGTDTDVYNYQSDRWYGPFAAASSPVDNWFDLAGRVERVAAAGHSPALLMAERAAAVVGDSALTPSAQALSAFGPRRGLNPWAIVADWSADSGVRSSGRCWIRDYWRVALVRHGESGDDRLYLDPVSAYPVQLSRTESHYLWGRVRADYRYLTWYDQLLPAAASRDIDGIADAYRIYTTTRLVPRDSAPSFALPAGLADMPRVVPRFLQAIPPDTIRVSPTLFLLKNPGYTEAVALVRDTVWILDATQSEQRAALDSAWIGKLFPGRHPLMLVVTDLAWPHIAGVRYWVAQGATVISHRMSTDPLKQVIDRSWRDSTDLLERRRSQMRFKFRAIDQPTELAGGAIRIVPLQGVGSEGGLGVWIPGEKFWWAGDYVQRLDQPTLYGREMIGTVRSAGAAPERFGAQHVGLAEWARLVAANSGR